MTQADWLTNRPWRIMPWPEFNRYLRGELLREGFDLSRHISRTSGIPGSDVVFSQELA